MTLEQIINSIKNSFATVRLDRITNIRDVEDVVLSGIREDYGEEEDYEGWAEEED